MIDENDGNSFKSIAANFLVCELMIMKNKKCFEQSMLGVRSVTAVTD